MAHDLVVVEQDIQLGVEKELLVFYRGGKVFRHSKLQDITQLVLVGQIELTHFARSTLLKKGIDVVFLSYKGQYLGRLWSSLSANNALRLAQYRFCLDTSSCLTAAKAIIAGKIANQRHLLLQAQRKLQHEGVAASLANMRIMLKKVDSATSLDSVRGYEGQSAALYFHVFPHLLRVPGFEMKGRSRRPPRDPVNALLSFGYTVLLGLLESQVLTAGLDPGLGCLHQIRHGMPSLVLDLLEEFRPLIVDTLTLKLINQRQIKPSDFYKPQQIQEAEEILWAEQEADPTEETEQDDRPAVYLAPTGHKIFFRAFYKRLREKVYYPPMDGQYEYQKIMSMQAYHLGRVIMGTENIYQPFTPK